MNNLFEIKNQKEKRITFRVTSDEFKILKEKAKDKNLTVKLQNFTFFKNIYEIK